jgi:hypothetical protein
MAMPHPDGERTVQNLRSRLEPLMDTRHLRAVRSDRKTVDNGEMVVDEPFDYRPSDSKMPDEIHEFKRRKEALARCLKFLARSTVNLEAVIAAIESGKAAILAEAEVARHFGTARLRERQLATARAQMEKLTKALRPLAIHDSRLLTLAAQLSKRVHEAFFWILEPSSQREKREPQRPRKTWMKELRASLTVAGLPKSAHDDLILAVGLGYDAKELVPLKIKRPNRRRN